jgi:hypothetical protein
VKTPLAFFFRVVGTLTLITLAGLIFIPQELRFRVFFIGVLFLAFLTILVFVFALVKPKNLVYGETGHRAELKFALGTEQHEIGPTEILTMEGTTNPKAISGGSDPV